MRAWHVERYGEPVDVLRLADVPDPVPGPGQVLVGVRAVAVNFPDVLLARGQYQERPPLPFVPGIELCGDVLAVGDGVDHVAVGDRVVGSRIGVLAERAVLDAHEVWPAPAGLSDEQAAGFVIAYQTAWFALHRRAGLRRGETVLVTAAAGGVGTATVQLAAAAGARVVGVVGSEAKAAAARDAGAHVVVDRSTQDVASAVREATGGTGADVVVDPVGGEAYEAATRCVAFEGRIVIVGFAGGTIQDARAGHALVKNYGVLGLHWALYARRRPDLVRLAHRALTGLVEQGAVRPVVSDVVPFEQAPEAVARLAGGGTTGRLVVRVA
ncbi:NADPH:quinone oxidoreductase family protein [Cellulomonas fimi]|uniref:NADPH:quinone oxidoreductase family protein n=1 Tax=Cellulomonas fimi TaxID=1708 RepID=UPI00234CF975|nr:NADPH:quinone oxidoreductase family protein [Cellulomonas fimi]MDC7123549.1 NADPH:quinone oxidoreductase family protein [Cellulomonas fimi]